MILRRLLVVVMIISAICLGFAIASGLFGSVLYMTAKFLENISLVMGDIAKDTAKISSAILIAAALGYVAIDEKRTG